MIQHGYLHTGSENTGPFVHRLRNRFITHQNAEFMGADYSKAKKAIESGQAILKKANISCSGFTSPTWYQSKETAKALQDCGFLYYTSYAWVKNGRGEKQIMSSALGDLGVGFPLGYMYMLGSAFMTATGLFCSPLARIVLHAQTAQERPYFTSALKNILRLARKRNIVTYSQYLESMANE